MRKKPDISRKRSQVLLLSELVEAITHASGAATGLIQLSGNPEAFFIIRDALELFKEGVLTVASNSAVIAGGRTTA